MAEPDYEKLAAQLEEKMAQEKVLRDEIAARELELIDVLSSTSWRLTKPVRTASSIARRIPDTTRKRIKRVLLRGGGTNHSERVVLKKRQQVKQLSSSISRKNWDDALGALQVLFEDTWKERFLFSVVSRLAAIDTYKAAIKNYTGRQPRKAGTPKIAIFTALTGGYETLKLPEKLDPRFDYFVFTDRTIADTGIFQIRPTTYFNEDSTRVSRFIKTHPHWFLKEYDIAVWLDASIMITGDIYPEVEAFIKSGKALGAIPHPHRTTIFEELNACITLGKDNAEEMIQQVNNYRDQGFDGHGLIESGLMMFNLRKPVARFLDTWWKEIDSYSRRDQLSVGFAITQNNLDWHHLTIPPHSIRDHQLFVLTPHDADANRTMLELINAVSKGEVDPFAHTPYAKVKSSRMVAQKDRSIDIVLCVHNAPEEVTKCLASIARHRKSNKQKLVIVDDGSDKPTADILKDFAKRNAWSKLIRHDKAGGYTKAANAGMKQTRGDLVILLNSDTIVTDGWAEKMADAVFSTPGGGMVGPMSSAASVQSLPDYESTKTQTAINDLPAGVTVDDMNTYCEQWSNAGFVPYATMLHGFCMGIRREVLNAIGMFDAKSFPRGYGEENDYCFRAVNAGFGLVVATHTYVFHAKSKSYTSEVRIGLMKQGSEKLRELYGKRRITNAIRSMQLQPTLVSMRAAARKLY